jgi:16S rRNA (uracil1498-N3)-methyltransferase
VSGHRFFVAPDVFDSSETRFPLEISRQIANVLRLKPGQAVTILDNLGHCRPVELTEIDTKHTEGQPGRIQPAGNEPAVDLILCPALTQREKFELILQKGCELGVKEFRPVTTARTLVQESRGLEDKLPRWQKILQEASEQCGRGLIPTIQPPVKFDVLVNRLVGIKGYIFHEKANDHGFIADLSAHLAKGSNQFALLIGPEGGFSEEEVTLARQAGLQPASLGQRVLRMETAAIAACAISMAAAGEMGRFIHDN